MSPGGVYRGTESVMGVLRYKSIPGDSVCENPYVISESSEDLRSFPVKRDDGRETRNSGSPHAFVRCPGCDHRKNPISQCKEISNGALEAHRVPPPTIMIKWLSASRLKNAKQCEPTPLTNDPLAVITGANNLDGKCQIYAVTRVNPLFKEERKEDCDNSGENGDQRLSPRKSISSGYESRCNSSSESSSCTECESSVTKKAVIPQRREKRWTRQAKKRSSDYDVPNASKSGHQDLPGAKRRSRKYKNGSPPGSSNLSPIPEGKIDCSIPPPIWPRFGTDVDNTKRDTQVPGGVPFHDGTTNPLNFMYKYNEKYPKCCNGRSRSLWNYFDERGHLSGAISVKTEYEHNWIECCRNQCNDSFLPTSLDGYGKVGALESTLRQRNQMTREVLRDLANFVSYAMKRKNVLSVEEILITLSESIQKSLDMLTHVEAVQDARDSKTDEIYSSGSEGKNSSSSSGCKEYSSSNSEKDNEYGSVQDRETKEKGKEQGRSSDSDTSRIHHQRDCSSSSTESGFCFSDCSPTPSSDSSSNERSRGVLNPVFLYDSVYGVPKSVRNAILCNSRNRTSESAFKEAAARDCGSSAFVKLISAKRKISSASVTDEIGPLTGQEDGKSYYATRTGPVKVDNNILKKVEHPYYIAVGRPDFTLDLPQAEKLMKTLSSSKRRRCWCRLMTSLLGLVFFLFSVMMVSLIVTKGKRLFGAL